MAPPGATVSADLHFLVVATPATPELGTRTPLIAFISMARWPAGIRRSRRAVTGRVRIDRRAVNLQPALIPDAGPAAANGRAAPPSQQVTRHFVGNRGRTAGAHEQQPSRIEDDVVFEVQIEIETGGRIPPAGSTRDDRAFAGGPRQSSVGAPEQSAEKNWR